MPIKLGSMIHNALVILTGRGPMSADDFGGDLWAGKKVGPRELELGLNRGKRGRRIGYRHARTGDKDDGASR